MLLKCAASINDEPLIPLRVAPPTLAFLQRLGEKCDDSTKPLSRFLLLVRPAQLVNEILGRLLPAELKRILAEIEKVKLQKEKAVADQEWDLAIVLRDQQRLLKDRLAEVGQNVVDVQPEEVLQAIYSLGYDQPISPN
ncbi:MAG: hypothetical protein ACJ8FY_09660 [Gemmataceae bacterium]